MAKSKSTKTEADPKAEKAKMNKCPACGMNAYADGKCGSCGYTKKS